MISHSSSGNESTGNFPRMPIMSKKPPTPSCAVSQYRRAAEVTFAGREVGREDDLLDFLVGCAVDIEVARQPSAEASIGVFDAAFLP